ncbi:MAG TPA: DUF167 domain-containing protein [Chlamydiales bacterium]|nr:DUF167 domain-containing protein [Chlamydiales bacterium]
MALIVQIKVTPNSSKNEILGYKEGVLCIRIRGVPEKGRVNEELIAFLAKELHIAKSQIAILSGHTSRLKRLQIDGNPCLKAINDLSN